jgi:hypothetical protein
MSHTPPFAQYRQTSNLHHTCVGTRSTPFDPYPSIERVRHFLVSLYHPTDLPPNIPLDPYLSLTLHRDGTTAQIGTDGTSLQLPPWKQIIYHLLEVLAVSCWITWPSNQFHLFLNKSTTRPQLCRRVTSVQNRPACLCRKAVLQPGKHSDS